MVMVRPEFAKTENVRLAAVVSKSLIVAIVALVAAPPCVRVNVGAGVRLGGVFAQLFNNKVRLFEDVLTTAISNRLSLFRSPISSETGPAPVGKSLGAKNVPSPLPGKMVMKSLELLVTTKSAFVSPSKSPTATSVGFAPVEVSVVNAPNDPSPAPSATTMLLDAFTATIKSGF